MSGVKVFAVAGSPRDVSYNRRLLALAARILTERGAVVDLFDVRQNLVPLYDPNLEAAEGFPPVVKDMRARVEAADAVLFASPEYNAGYTPLLKSVIDWGSRTDPDTEVGNVWSGKVGACVSASPGALGGARGMIALRQTLAHVEVLLIPEFTIVPNAGAAFAEDGTLTNERSAKGVVRTMERLIRVAERMRG
jgi:NAD(P)H-dependent FMN reductase